VCSHVRVAGADVCVCVRACADRQACISAGAAQGARYAAARVQQVLARECPQG